MKKGAIFLIAVLCINLVWAIDSPQTNINPDDQTINKIQENINKIPLNEEGKIDSEKLTNYKSKAELRIQAINSWLETHAVWFKSILGVVPSISWYFAAVLYFFLLGIVVFILNSRTNLYNRFLSMNLGAQNTSLYIGIIIFAILFIALKVQVFLANIFYLTWTWANDKWYRQLIRFIAIIISTLILTGIINVWGKYRKKKGEEAEKEKTELAGKIVQKTAEGITRD